MLQTSGAMDPPPLTHQPLSSEPLQMSAAPLAPLSEHPCSCHGALLPRLTQPP